MTRIIVLDSGPLGELVHPRRRDEISAWAARLVAGGADIVVPEIADCEVRRELSRVGSLVGLRNLYLLQQSLAYAPISTAAMRLAARLWADARRQGRPTAGADALDADVILAAQAMLVTGKPDDDVIVATINVGHLGRYLRAAHWREIQQ